MSLLLFRHGSSISETFQYYPGKKGFMATKTVGTGTADTTIVNWSSELWDSDGAFNTSTGEWTVPRSGAYIVFGQAAPVGGITTTESGCKIFVNGSERVRGSQFVSPRVHLNTSLTTLIQVLDAGDVVTLVQFSDVGEGCAFGAIALPFYNLMMSEGAGASGSAGGTIGNWTEELDTEGAFNSSTGVYTVPSDGVYFWNHQGFPDSGVTSTWEVVPKLNGSSVTGTTSTFVDTGRGIGQNMNRNRLLSMLEGVELSLVQSSDQAIQRRFDVLRLASDGYWCGYSTATPGDTTAITSWTMRASSSSDFNSSTGIFTAPTDGPYFIHFNTHGSENNDFLRAYIYHEGSEVLHGAAYVNEGYTSNAATSAALNLTAGDTVDFRYLNGATAHEFVIVRA